MAFAVILLLSISALAILSPMPLDDHHQLRAVALQAGYTGSINVTVRNDLGMPMVGATVRILGNTSATWPQTDVYGKANITGVYAATAGTLYGVAAEMVGYAPVNKTVTVLPDTTTLLNLTLQGRKIFGIIESSVGGPVANATIWLDFLSMRFSVNVTEPDGSFIFGGLPGGFTHHVTASALGYVNTSKDVAVPEDTDANGGMLVLTPNTGTITGFVRSGTNLLYKVNISLLGTSLYNVSEPDGSFQLVNITAGTYNLTATKAGYNPAWFIIIISPGGQVDLRINLTAMPGLILKGVVKDDEGAFLVNVMVSIVTAESQQRTEFTNIEGVFEFTGLTAGNYTLEFEMAGYRPMIVGHISIADGTPSNITFTMSPLRHGFSGFIFGFDMAHSMMILALFLTIVILALAVYMRIKTFQAPENAPAVYDQEEEEEGKEGEKEAQSENGKAD